MKWQELEFLQYKGQASGLIFGIVSPYFRHYNLLDRLLFSFNLSTNALI